MRFVSNVGSDRVLDLVRPWMQPGHQLDMVSPMFSLFAYSALLDELPCVSKAVSFYRRDRRPSLRERNPMDSACSGRPQIALTATRSRRRGWHESSQPG